ncbi:hypothetical protein Shyhy02_80240 [Streptomyces hygroscopicus subsp. hygroscopicus]|nr:hypothetical protein Shyhy02_80240 [Streptomyces hygroscopicus subsp. hygroscopicus]
MVGCGHAPDPNVATVTGRGVFVGGVCQGELEWVRQDLASTKCATDREVRHRSRCAPPMGRVSDGMGMNKARVHDLGL